MPKIKRGAFHMLLIVTFFAYFKIYSMQSLSAQRPFKVDEFSARYFEQPLDHFTSTNGHTFQQRYWVNKRYYKTGGPIFVLDGGETSGEDRLPFLDTGVMDFLPKATGGLGIVLEHRYYGRDLPCLLPPFF